jgi:hypothetical protein
MKISRRLMPFCLLWVVLLAMPAAVQAQFNLTTNGDGSINISGYAGSGGTVIIPSTIFGLPVTSIGQGAFQNSSVTSVTIPDSVISLGQSAFFNDTALTSINIGNGVASIQDSTFNSDPALKNVTIGNAVTSIGYFAFRGCTSLTNIIMPNSLTNFGDNNQGDDLVFASCPNLTGVYFQGNAPSSYGHVYLNENNQADNFVTNYYLLGTTGWGIFYNANHGSSGAKTNLWPGAFAYTASPTNGVLPLTVQFTSTNRDGGNNLITNWNWNFGDGTTSTNQNPSHVYTTGIAGGKFPSGLLAVNNLGKTVAGFGLTIAVTPPNDNFSNSIPLSGGGIGSNLGATLESKEPNPGGSIGSVTNSATNGITSVVTVTNAVNNTVWWSWTAPTNGLASVLTYGSSIDTIIAIYTGNALTNLVCLASNLNTVLNNDLYAYSNSQVGVLSPANAGVLNRVGFTASAGTNYQIQISGLSQGLIDIAVQPIALKVVSVNRTSTNSADQSVNFNGVVQVGNSGSATSAPLRLKVLAHAGYSFDSNNGSLPNTPNALPADQVLTNYYLANPATASPGTTTNISISAVCPGPSYNVSNGSTNWAFGWGAYVVLEEQFGTNWYFVDNDLLLYGTWPTIGGVQGVGGGVIRLNPSQLVTSSNPGYVQYQLVPPAALLAGAGWKLSNDSNFATATNYIEAVTATNTVLVQFKAITGWNPPASQTVTVLPGQVTSQTASYTVTNPVLVAGSLGIGITGTTNTAYRIEGRTSLAGGSWQPVSTNTITSGSFNLVLPAPLTNAPAMFYRAVWLGY